MAKALDISGLKFNRLTALNFSHRKYSKRIWRCLCECGKETFVETNSITSGKTKSCGCLQQEVGRLVCVKRNTTHNLSKSREYKIWNDMKRRCYDPRVIGYERYGLLGISICKRWMKFENFYKDMGPADKHLSIDRINGKLGYSKKNCRWATIFEQANNRSNNHIIEYNGKSMTMKQWSDYLPIDYFMLRARIKYGWTIEKAFFTPKRVYPKAAKAGMNSEIKA